MSEPHICWCRNPKYHRSHIPLNPQPATRQIAKVTSREAMTALEPDLPDVVIVKVSTFLLSDLLGKEYTTEGGVVVSMDSVNFYVNDGTGTVEAEPVFFKRVPEYE